MATDNRGGHLTGASTERLRRGTMVDVDGNVVDAYDLAGGRERYPPMGAQVTCATLHTVLALFTQCRWLRATASASVGTLKFTQ